MGEMTERRNAPGTECRVKSVEDFEHEGSLDAKVKAMLENRHEIVIRNVEYLIRKEESSQAELCAKKLEGSPGTQQMTSYKKVGKDIPYWVITRVAMSFGYTPEQFSGQLLEKSGGQGQVAGKLPLRPKSEYPKYIGTYHLAYFKTDAALGDNRRSAARDLANGMLTVYPGDAVDGIPTLHVIAFFNCTDQEADRLARTVSNAERQQSNRGIHTCYKKVATPENDLEGDSSRMKCLYEGDLILTERCAEITLRQITGSDTVHITLHNQAANSSEGSIYKGGLGIMMSVSRGEEHMPCTQAIILSRKGFANTAKEELADSLFLEPPEVKLENETRDIISYVKALFPPEDSDNPLAHISASDKEFMLNDYIERKIKDVIKRNYLRCYKVSSVMDSAVYKKHCR